MRLGIPLFANACASVLQMIKFTPSITWLYMWLTALPPPPPTPITLMMDDFSLGRSKCIIVFEFYNSTDRSSEDPQSSYQIWVSCFLLRLKELITYIRPRDVYP